MIDLLFGIYKQLGGVEIDEPDHQWAMDVIDMTGREAMANSEAMEPRGSHR